MFFLFRFFVAHDAELLKCIALIFHGFTLCHLENAIFLLDFLSFVLVCSK
jgi:hypothetical protein